MGSTILHFRVIRVRKKKKKYEHIVEALDVNKEV
jgi:hypothetical protein